MTEWTTEMVDEFLNQQSDKALKEFEKLDMFYAACFVKAFLVMSAFIDTNRDSLSDYILETFKDEEKYEELMTAFFVSEKTVLKYYAKHFDPLVKQQDC